MRYSLKAIVALATLVTLTSAHGDHDDLLADNTDATYAEMHMASEHHFDSFDLNAFFHLHDLNRDGILDVNELESIYGVHHEKLKKKTGSVEVHTQQAKEIVKVVLEKLDTNGDGLLTMKEFLAGGVAGLPNFKGVEHLGHHYDAEGEYFLHHEEKYHNTPETQNEEDYIHPEDIEHFTSHDQIEAEENRRSLEFQGLLHEAELDITDEELGNPSDHEHDVAEPVFQDAVVEKVAPATGTEGEEEKSAPDHPDAKTIHENEEAARALAEEEVNDRRRLSGRKSAQNKFLTPPPVVAKPPPRAGNDNASANQNLGAEEKARQERAAFARAQAERFGRDSREASRRGEWGTDEGAEFRRPKDAADRLRKAVPYKFKVKKSFWGEF